MKKAGLLAAAVALTASSAYAGDGIEINKFLSLSGFIDMSYTSTDVDTAGATEVKTFALDQAELDFHLNFGNGLTGRVDIEGGNSASRVQSIAGGSNVDDIDIDQARIDLNLGTVTLTFGKWDTFIGLEGLEPVDLYQYSNSLSWELAPTQQTGISVGYDNGVWNAALALVNSIDNQNPDNNDSISFQGHLGFTPWENLKLNFNFAVGDEGGTGGAATTAATEADTTLFTFDVQYKNAGWTFGAEYASRDADVNGGTDNENDSFMIMVNYAFTEQFSLTGRFSQNEGETGGDMSEFTLAPVFALSPNWSVLLEYRTESGSTTYSGDTVGIGGGTVDADRIALETTLSF